MKGQDIVLLLKLVSLHRKELPSGASEQAPVESVDWEDWQDWEGWDADGSRLILPEHRFYEQKDIASRYTARSLEEETGISKSQINLALNRCIDVGLAKKDRKSGVPRANVQALYGFIVHGLKYVFPAKPGEITRGIATAFAAPVLNQQLMSAGEFVPVWPDARGNTKGQAIEPLCKSVAYAVRRDPEMYALLALVDAIRIGQPREANLAADLLKQRLGAK
ncbi:MAG: hypothetical protein H6999_12850 [Hahellaceae bacterium]|nr:hypothetical protein [Hahellaceae bacterium]MCP5171283.1 hypothetical protein [Pseudomonadales bacterium]